MYLSPRSALLLSTGAPERSSDGVACHAQACRTHAARSERVAWAGMHSTIESKATQQEAHALVARWHAHALQTRGSLSRGTRAAGACLAGVAGGRDLRLHLQSMSPDWVRPEAAAVAGALEWALAEAAPAAEAVRSGATWGRVSARRCNKAHLRPHVLPSGSV